MQIDLYVNKKFDVIKIINLVLKRKDWGKTYTLYKTTTHEVLTQMRSYNFTDKYATFDIKINEINGYGYYSSQIVLNKVPVEFYKPKTTVEYSEISRMEKIRTDIFASMAEGASHVQIDVFL